MINIIGCPVKAIGSEWCFSLIITASIIKAVPAEVRMEGTYGATAIFLIFLK
jgi:hypothetical protein